MSMDAFTTCVNDRGAEYERAISWVADELEDAAEEAWEAFASWFSALSTPAQTVLTLIGAQGAVASREALTKGLGVMMSGAALEVIVAVILGLGLGIAIDIVRECGPALI